MESGNNSDGYDCSLDFGFGFNNVNFSDRTLLIDLIPESNGSKPDPVQDSDGHETVGNNENLSPTTEELTTQVKAVHISTIVLAVKSPFFYKLFSNGMAESNQRNVTLSIQKSEEAAFMDLLKFMYTNTVSTTTPSGLIDVLVVADKYEVALCLKYCFQLLQKLPMTYELALRLFNLPSTILRADRAQSLVDSAKEYLVVNLKDISKYQEEILNLPLAGFEAILSSDDLQLTSEDEIYDFVMTWARKHYTKPGKRQEILVTHLLRLIRFPFMSRNKLEEVLVCTDIILEHRSKIIFDAISCEAPPPPQRAYKLRPVKVMRLYSPCEECVVYLDLKREECERILPDSHIKTCEFHLDGQTFYLEVWRIVDKLKSVSSFGLYMGMLKNISVVTYVVEYEFSSRMKPSEKFVVVDTKEYNFALGIRDETYNIFHMPRETFIADNSPYFINGILHLRAVLKIKKAVLN